MFKVLLKTIIGFIVENSKQGINCNVIKNKLSVRVVQNCKITFDNVFIK